MGKTPRTGKGSTTKSGRKQSPQRPSMTALLAMRRKKHFSKKKF
jgi:hypothetical protein